jgi:hypothetical protein
VKEFQIFVLSSVTPFFQSQHRHNTILNSYLCSLSLFAYALMHNISARFVVPAHLMEGKRI